MAKQNDTIQDILNTHNTIEYFHHGFIYGGSENITAIRGADSIITWEIISKTFQLLHDKKNHYFTKVLSEGVNRYLNEFPNRRRLPGEAMVLALDPQKREGVF